MAGPEDDLVVTVDHLARIQDRFESEQSDGGSSGRSDGPEGDGKNDIYQ